MEKLEFISKNLGKSYDIRIEYIPSMRVLSSYTKASNGEGSDTDAWYEWITQNNFPPKVLGNHDHFDYHDTVTGNLVCLRRIADTFVNDSPFTDFIFDDSYFAALIAYFDQDMGSIADYLSASIEHMDNYILDTSYIKKTKIACMGEEMLSPFKTCGRYDIFMPVTKV